jgi:putative oxidoreductase
MRIAREVALWLIAIFLAFVFVRQGYAKFFSTSGWARAFRLWHFPDGFRILVGVVEVAAGLIVLIPRLARIGAIMIAVVMLGAMATHVYWGHPRQVTNEILPLVLSALLAAGRWRRS